MIIMANKIHLAILFGGKSAEHEVSLESARSIIDAVDREKYEVILIGIDKMGRFYVGESAKVILEGTSSDPSSLKSEDHVAWIPDTIKGHLIYLSTRKSAGHVDVVFPALHGPYGEDGTIQGLLKLVHVPFAGADVLGSAVGMDKDVMKRLLRDSGIPVPDFVVLNKKVYDRDYQGKVEVSGEKMTFDDLGTCLGLPFFVKPANLGSSVGITRVSSEEMFEKAVNEAFQYDHKILAEENIRGREIECSVMGNDDPFASVPGEVISRHDFYSYDAKYVDDHGADLVIPAQLSEYETSQIQKLAVQTFRVTCCKGMARVDFFLRENGDIIINEINTIPGFTKISMYPKLWDASGISFTELIDRLVALALERFEDDRKLKTTFK